ncbi:hypothetical protein Syun_019121 [Stephania yunnanensis]|uniref:Uncharacterized protein n=1 Tax=Stephania yunnanensis TaxID=152371 RepID=A0AAP0ITN0_9MAGN
MIQEQSSATREQRSATRVEEGARVRNTTTQRHLDDKEQRSEGEEHDDAEAFGRQGAEGVTKTNEQTN